MWNCNLGRNWNWLFFIFINAKIFQFITTHAAAKKCILEKLRFSHINVAGASKVLGLHPRKISNRLTAETKYIYHIKCICTKFTPSIIKIPPALQYTSGRPKIRALSDFFKLTKPPPEHTVGLEFLFSYLKNIKRFPAHHIGAIFFSNVIKKICTFWHFLHLKHLHFRINFGLHFCAFFRRAEILESLYTPTLSPVLLPPSFEYHS